MSRIWLSEPMHALAAASDSRIAVGRISRISNEGCPWVTCGGRSEPVRAQTLFSVESTEELQQLIGADVLVLIHDDDPDGQPIILGQVRDSLMRPRTLRVGQPLPDKRVVVEARDELLIKCGDSSIHLRRDGRVTTKGKHVVSRSSGVNKIKGSSVQLN
jgi:hypothetical protein